MYKRCFHSIFLFIFLLSCFASSQTLSEKPGDSSYLESLCKVWGKIKFTHPYVYLKNIDWDAALIDTLPLVRAAESKEDFEKAINHLLSYLDDPVTKIVREPAKSEASSEKTETEKKQPYVDTTDDGIAIIVATDYGKFSYDTLNSDFYAAFAQATKSEKIILDLRNMDGEESSLISNMVEYNLPSLLKNDIHLPPLRFIEHEGYGFQSGPVYYMYHTDLTVRASIAIRGRNQILSKTPQIVILLNDNSADISSALTALQENCDSIIIFEGNTYDTFGITITNMSILDDLNIQIRTAEILRSDGSAGFSPDLVVSENAMDAGLNVLRGQKEISKKSTATSVISNKNVSFNSTEKSYPEMEYPDANYRMLALFRFWNVIEYFYPYKDLMDHSWDSILTEFIPLMDKAENAQGYALTIARLVAKLQDSHGIVFSKHLDKYFGDHIPPVKIDRIEGWTVVTKVSEENNPGFEVGDIILSIDGTPTLECRGRLEPLIAASTPGRLNDLVNLRLLAGEKDSEIKLELQKASSEVKTITTKRSRSVAGFRMWSRESDTPVYSVLPEGMGYIDFGRLTSAEVDKALETVKDTPGLVLDIRSNHRGGAWQVGQKIAREKFYFSRLEFIQYDGSIGMFFRREQIQSLPSLSDKPAYSGKITMLIGNSTESSGEHTCLLMESVAEVTFIGSPTSGANGNMTQTVLPGGIIVWFTGLGVRHLDGRQLQRVGIQPDIHVERTIEGVRQGRDEVLERAVKFLIDQTSN